MAVTDQTPTVRKVLATSTISSKGQITLPVEVRRRLGVKLGDRVEFSVENGRTIVLPVREPGNPFEKYIGSAPAFSTAEDINAWVRDLRDDEYEADQTRKATAAPRP